jgi:AcrR family transcriptional regulator
VVRKSNDGSGHAGAERVRRRAETRRLEILRAAGRVFRRRGFAETGMREIAAEADLSPGNLYHYFGGKHEILYFCQDRALDQMLGALDTARRSKLPHDERLRGVIQAHVHCLLDDVEGSAAHLEVESLPDDLRRAIITKRDRYERGLCRLVAGGVRRASFAPCDPKLVTRAMLGAINWTARWFRSDGPRPASGVAGDVAEYLIRGLVAQPTATDKTGAKIGASR